MKKFLNKYISLFLSCLLFLLALNFPVIADDSVLEIINEKKQVEEIVEEILDDIEGEDIEEKTAYIKNSVEKIEEKQKTEQQVLEKAKKIIEVKNEIQFKDSLSTDQIKERTDVIEDVFEAVKEEKTQQVVLDEENLLIEEKIENIIENTVIDQQVGTEVDEKTLGSVEQEKKVIEVVVEVAEVIEQIEKTTDITESKIGVINNENNILESIEQKILNEKQLDDAGEKSNKEIKEEVQQKVEVIKKETDEIKKILEENSQIDKKIQQEVIDLDKQMEDTIKHVSEVKKEKKEKVFQATQSIIAIENQKKLENVKRINEILNEGFEEDLNEIFIEEVKEKEEEKITLKIKMEEENIKKKAIAADLVSDTQQQDILKKEIKEDEESLKALKDQKNDLVEKKVQESAKIVEKIKSEKIIEPPIFFALQETVSVNNFSDIVDDEKAFDQHSISFIFKNISYILGLKKKEGKIIALIDTGVDTQHIDLKGQFWTSDDCVDEKGEKIQSGCFKGGWDFVDGDDDPYDIQYVHGTAVAGILGAKTNNKEGIMSLTGILQPETKIMALKACCSVEGYFEAQTIAKSIYFAVNNGADVINMSFGGPTYSKSIEEAIAYAQDKGVLIVSAAGNYGLNNDVTSIYPANFNLEYDNVVSVAALDSNGKIANFSNYGEKTVDIAAPGFGVFSTSPGNQYDRFTGTSFSTPMVTSILTWVSIGDTVSKE